MILTPTSESISTSFRLSGGHNIGVSLRALRETSDNRMQEQVKSKCAEADWRTGISLRDDHA